MSNEEKLRQILHELQNLINNASSKKIIEQKITEFINNYNALAENFQSRLELIDSEISKVDYEIAELDNQLHRLKQLENNIEQGFKNFEQFVKYVSSQEFKLAVKQISNLSEIINNLTEANKKLANQYKNLAQSVNTLMQEVRIVNRELKETSASFTIAYKKVGERLSKSKKFENILFSVVLALLFYIALLSREILGNKAFIEFGITVFIGLAVYGALWYWEEKQ